MRQLGLKRADPMSNCAPRRSGRLPQESEEDGGAPVFFSRHSALPKLTVVPRAPSLSDVNTDKFIMATRQAKPMRHLLAPIQTRRPTLLSDSHPNNPGNIPPRPGNPACPVRPRPCHPVGISEPDGCAVWPFQPGCQPSKPHLVQKELDLAGAPAREVKPGPKNPNPLVHRVPLLARRAEMNKPKVVAVREPAPPCLFPAIAKGNVSLVKAKKRKKAKKAQTSSLGPSGAFYQRRFMLE